MQEEVYEHSYAVPYAALHRPPDFFARHQGLRFKGVVSNHHGAWDIELLDNTTQGQNNKMGACVNVGRVRMFFCGCFHRDVPADIRSELVLLDWDQRSFTVRSLTIRINGFRDQHETTYTMRPANNGTHTTMRAVRDRQFRSHPVDDRHAPPSFCAALEIPHLVNAPVVPLYDMVVAQIDGEATMGPICHGIGVQPRRLSYPDPPQKVSNHLLLPVSDLDLTLSPLDPVSELTLSPFLFTPRFGWTAKVDRRSGLTEARLKGNLGLVRVVECIPPRVWTPWCETEYRVSYQGKLLTVKESQLISLPQYTMVYGKRRGRPREVEIQMGRRVHVFSEDVVVDYPELEGLTIELEVWPEYSPSDIVCDVLAVLRDKYSTYLDESHVALTFGGCILELDDPSIRVLEDLEVRWGAVLQLHVK